MVQVYLYCLVAAFAAAAHRHPLRIAVAAAGCRCTDDFGAFAPSHHCIVVARVE